MLTIPRWKLWSIIGICLAGILFALPNALPPQVLQSLPTWLQNTINLGLELKGGSHLQLEVDLKAVSKEYLSNLLEEARATLRKQQVGYTGLLVDTKSTTPTLNFTLRDPSDTEKASSLLKKNRSTFCY